MENNQSEDIQEKELVISRIFDVPREIVWKAWTEPERAKEWWGPRTFTVPTVEMDLRAGGRYVICMRSSDGKDYWSTGNFREVSAPGRLVMTDSFADEKGNPVNASFYGMNPDYPMESLVTVTFDEEDGKTKFTLKYDDVSMIPKEDLAGMKQGWSESFDKLSEYVKR